MEVVINYENTMSELKKHFIRKEYCEKCKIGYNAKLMRTCLKCKKRRCIVNCFIQPDRNECFFCE